MKSPASDKLYELAFNALSASESSDASETIDQDPETQFTRVTVTSSSRLCQVDLLRLSRELDQVGKTTGCIAILAGAKMKIRFTIQIKTEKYILQFNAK